MTDAHFVPIGARPAPRQQRKSLVRLLFGDFVSAVLTVASVALVMALLPAIKWATLDAVWHADAGSACQQGGACWAFIGAKLRLILFGLYPPEEQWRPVVVIAIVLVMVLATLSPKLWGRKLFLLWILASVAMLALMTGGFAGLALVPTNNWGGLPVTLLLSLLSLGIGFPFAVLLAFGRCGKLPVARFLSLLMIEVVRGVPLVSMLFIASILLPLLLPDGWTIDKLGRTLAALTLFSAAYLSEVLRGGLQAIPKGQFEAAKALGMSWRHAVTHIILPQAIQKVIPPLTNTAVVLVKDTSLVMIVGVFDMLGAGRAAAGDPAWPAPFTETYVFVGGVYFAICISISLYSRWLEQRVNARSHS